MDRLKPPWMLKRELLVKAQEKTDLRFGCRPEERSLKDYIRLGIINLDKTGGPSSHEVTAWLKRLMNLTHAGHGGTLVTSSRGSGEIPK